MKHIGHGSLNYLPIDELAIKVRETGIEIFLFGDQCRGRRHGLMLPQIRALLVEEIGRENLHVNSRHGIGRYPVGRDFA